MAHLIKKDDQNLNWEYEVDDNKIIAVLPESSFNVRVLIKSTYETKEVICSKISFV